MVVNAEIRVNTRGDTDMVDITARVEKIVLDSRIQKGTVTVFVSGSTAGITTMEFEPGLVGDLQKMWERLVPRNISYGHNERWGDGNGYAHVRASLLGASLTIPIADRKMALGTWQQIVLVDFDNRPRQRTVVAQVVGE